VTEPEPQALSEQELRRQQRHAEREARRAEGLAAKQQAMAEREARKEEERQRRQAAQEALDAQAARACDRYLAVREWARGWRDDYAAAAGEPTEPERQRAQALAHLWDAPRETITTLRRWCEPLGGARASDYDTRETELFDKLKREVFYARKQLGPDLFVHEPRALGGFGFFEQALLYNEDTARHFALLIALQDAAIVQAFREPGLGDPGPRRVVWEIGGGWGGFAYQFTRVCSNVTYVISGSPEQLLVSAVYLAGVLPEARCRLHGGELPSDGPDEWDDADFVFVPGHLIASMRTPRLDLVLDLLELRAMTAERAAAHVRRAFELGARYVFALRPGVSDPADRCVEQAIGRWYWPHPVPPRRDPRELSAVGYDASKLPPPRFAHLAGWRRIRA
jgi:hypothetical protein